MWLCAILKTGQVVFAQVCHLSFHNSIHVFSGTEQARNRYRIMSEEDYGEIDLTKDCVIVQSLKLLRGFKQIKLEFKVPAVPKFSWARCEPQTAEDVRLECEKSVLSSMEATKLHL